MASLYSTLFIYSRSLMQYDLDLETKLILMEKIIEYGMDMIDQQQIESICPDRIMIYDFDT